MALQAKAANGYWRKNVATPSMKRVTATQIAKSLGVSQTTVSMVLNDQSKKYNISEATTKRIKDEARRLGYRPSSVARQLAGMPSNAVGVLLSTAAPADPRLLQAMELLAAERGIRFIVGHAVGAHDRVQDYLDDFRARDVDGIISIFHNHPDYRDAVLPKLAEFDRVVYYEKPLLAGKGESACYVEPDFFEVGRLAVQHLVDRGRRRIGLVLNHLLFPFARARLDAYKQVLKEAGCEVDKELIWVMDEQPDLCWTDPFTEETALRVVDELVLKRKADGIVLVNDFYAAWTVAALRRRGLRIPDDVAVVSCNDLDIGPIIDPPLTAVNLRVNDLASAIMDMLFKLLDAGKVPAKQRAVVVKPRLTVRESS